VPTIMGRFAQFYLSWVGTICIVGHVGAGMPRSGGAVGGAMVINVS